MKKTKLVICLTFFIYIFSSFSVFAKTYSYSQINRVLSQISSSVVYATVTADTYLYQSPASSKTFSIEEGCEVEIIKDRTSKWYYVIDNLNERKGWISTEFLYIPDDKATNKSKMTKEDIECFINYMSFSSKSRYLVWTDIDRQVTHVFTGREQNWELLKSFDCSTGKNISPTLKGVFTLAQRGLWFYSERLKSGARYWIRYKDSYLFHSVAMDKDKNIIDPVVCEKRSSGCIRLTVPDIKWFYENVPDGTTVFIY